jgi:PAS domain-containing protein
MSEDLTDRLRAASERIRKDHNIPVNWGDLAEAADELDRLRAKVERLESSMLAVPCLVGITDMQHRIAELEAALREIRTAVEDEGVQPRHHRRVMARHEQEWPTLWKAIRRALEVNE